MHTDLLYICRFSSLTGTGCFEVNSEGQKLINFPYHARFSCSSFPLGARE
jgi:hypothetical protein